MTDSKPKSFEITYTVPFHDLDPMQVVWHGNYLKYFDMARFALLRSCGVDLYEYSLTHQMIFPVTRSATKYIVPLRYKDEFLCRATVTEARYKIAMDFEIRLVADNTVCTRGSGEQVAVTLPDNDLQFEIPPDIQRALGY
jgi:acyl-CoA thioester hydrolase